MVRKRMIQHIPVLEVFPENKVNESLPLVIYYHGWQTKKELALTAGKKIAQKNIRVVIPDSMYHGERRIETPSTIPSFRFWSTIQYNLSEFPIIKSFYEKRNLIKNQSLGVAGFSMGGMTTSGILTHYPEVKVAAILMGTPNYSHFISRVSNYLEKEKIYSSSLLIDLLSWTKNFDLNTMPQKMNGRPIYFWHGTEDVKLPFKDTYQFYLDNKETLYGENMTFVTGQNEPHLLTIQIMNQTADFFKQHFPN